MKITLERSWLKQEPGRIKWLEDLRRQERLEREMVKEVAGVTKIPLRFISKKKHVALTTAEFVDEWTEEGGDYYASSTYKVTWNARSRN